MNAKAALLSVLLVLSACVSEPVLSPLPPQVAPVAEGQSLSVRLDQGEVLIRGGAQQQVQVAGGALFPDKTEYSLTALSDEVRVIARYSGRPASELSLRLDVSVPDNIPLKIESDSASITVRDYEGEVEVVSISGPIFVQGVNGVVVARSNRGNVSVQDSAGTISVVGNYGVLALQGAAGDIGVSTIMGAITFSGPIGAGDAVRLETDHGPVAVNLSQGSDLSIAVRSTSGDVTCLLPGISASLRACDGALNAGGGALTVRTVSGAVTLQLIP